MTQSLTDLFRVFGRIGLMSFGGPAAQIALMHRELVENRDWLTERQFLNALSFCMLLPGPEAMQLATYSGWRLRGTLGGLIAGLLFVLPGAAVVLALALTYAHLGNVPLVQSLFLGVKAAVVIIVLQALLKVARRALHGGAAWVVAALSFVGIFAFHLPFPAIVFIAAVYGFVTSGAASAGMAPPLSRTVLQTAGTVTLWLAIWALPLVIVGPLLGNTFLTELWMFFSTLAIVTFGGAYAVLAYMTQAVVADFGWLTTAQMMDGLGLAETTPGPLILVTEFVGTLAGYEKGGTGLALAAATVTLWATFAPCFLWIFTGAPYIEWITHQPRLKAALDAITAAVVGVILNLSLWFAIHVFFARVALNEYGPIRLLSPQLASVDWRAVSLALIAGYLLLRLKLGLPTTLGIMALAGVAVSFV